MSEIESIARKDLEMQNAEKRFMTISELMERYGLGRSFFERKSQVIEPARVKLAGKTIKPYRYDVQIFEQLFRAEGQAPREDRSIPVRAMKKRREKIARARVATSGNVDELFD